MFKSVCALGSRLPRDEAQVKEDDDKEQEDGDSDDNNGDYHGEEREDQDDPRHRLSSLVVVYLRRFSQG